MCWAAFAACIWPQLRLAAVGRRIGTQPAWRTYVLKYLGALEQKKADNGSLMHPTMKWEASPGWTVHVPWSSKIDSYTIYNDTQRKECEMALAKRDPRLGAIYTNHGEANPKCIMVVEDEVR